MKKFLLLSLASCLLLVSCNESSNETSESLSKDFFLESETKQTFNEIIEETTKNVQKQTTKVEATDFTDSIGDVSFTLHSTVIKSVKKRKTSKNLYF